VGWRLYAQRTVTGEWLDTNVQMRADFTWALGAANVANGVIPTALDQEDGPDGHPLWLERGTTLYAEEDNRLAWVGLCSWQRPTKAGRALEFHGLTKAYDLIGFDGVIREWQPDAFNLVGRLINNGEAQPDGNLGLTVVADGASPGYAGDEEPPAKPAVLKRRRGETAAAFQKRRDARQKALEAWEESYGDREPYVCAWWDAPYIGEEIAELATELPFDYYERHEWANRAALTRRSELVLTPHKGRRRLSLALVEGINLASVIDPQTNTDGYGNNVVMLGAGEGRKMARAAIGARDMRVRTTRYVEAKNVHNTKRLEARARAEFAKLAVGVTIDEAIMRGDLGGLELGDEVQIKSRIFTGWGRVQSVTRGTRGGNVTLGFSAA
jgi:hypothetical protein